MRNLATTEPTIITIEDAPKDLKDLRAEIKKKLEDLKGKSRFDANDPNLAPVFRNDSPLCSTRHWSFSDPLCPFVASVRHILGLWQLTPASTVFGLGFSPSENKGVITRRFLYAWWPAATEEPYRLLEKIGDVFVIVDVDELPREALLCLWVGLKGNPEAVRAYCAKAAA